MRLRRLLDLIAAVSCVAMLLSCGSGGSGGEINPSARPAPPKPSVSDPNAFLIFPNAHRQADGSLQTLSTEYAHAYYRAIDPANDKDTLEKWKAANGFGGASGAEVTVVFGDVRDLGYGRRMTARRNADGSMAFMVENYLVEAVAGYDYSNLNLDAAVFQDRRWHLSTNTIEVSPGPAGGVPFAKFFAFNAATGARELSADLDGRGDKAMPGPCITCHGGRGDPLTPPDASGLPLFARVEHSASGARGDVLAQLHVLEVDHLDFSTWPGFTRADQEAAIKAINQMVLCSYAVAAASAYPEDACRRVANANEWQGTAATLIKSAYGGDGLPSAAYSDTFVPDDWAAAGQTALYRDVVTPACRACHILRGSGSQSSVDLATFAKFQHYADRIKAHVIDHGNMPLAKIVFDAFWRSAPAVEQTGAFLEGEGFAVRDATGAVLRPGRPVADPGPDRVVRPGTTELSAAASLFATDYRWSLVSGPPGATLADANSRTATLMAVADGSYVVQLIASAKGIDSAPAQLNLVVSSALAPAPDAIRFADIKALLQGPAGCIGCHRPGGAGGPPIVFTNVDRNGDGIAGDATDDLWFYTQLRGLINFDDVAASPLLRKPSGTMHFRIGIRSGFDPSLPPGQPGRANYDLFVNWILNGAPQ